MQQTVTTPWASDINLDDEPPVSQPTGDEEAPWELEESDDEKAQQGNPASQTNFFPDTQKPVLAVRQRSSSISTSGSDGDADQNQTKTQENYDDYFANAPANNEDSTSASAASPKNVRFDENIEQVNVLTPKDSLDNSEATSTSDSDEDDDHHHELGNGFPTMSDRISDHMNGESILHQPVVTKVEARSIQQQPESEISLDESEDLPPPLPSLPPMHGKKGSFLRSTFPFRSKFSPPLRFSNVN